MKTVALFLMVLLLLALPQVGAARVDGSGSSASLNLYFNVDSGIALSPTGFYMIPGPQINIEQNTLVTFILYATDNLTSHQVFIDVDGSGNLSINDLISGTFDSITPTQITFELKWSGLRMYGDRVRPGALYGFINGVEPAPAPVPVPPPSDNTTVPPPGPSWFRFDPFFIFGLMMELSLIAYVGWLVWNYFKLRKLKKKITDEDALKWAKAIMDPDAPARMNKEQVLEYNQKNLVKTLKRLRPHRAKKNKKA